jgi:ABC-type transporter Mla subunit MlaD
VSDYETSQKRRNIVVGIFVFTGLCALVWLIFKFGDLPVIVHKFDSYRVFVQFPTASGVQNDTPVNFCGYQIGRVTEVRAPRELKDRITGLTYYQTLVVINIDNRYKNIPVNVDVKLMTRSLGSGYIELKQRPGVEPKPIDPNRPETKFLFGGVSLQGSTGLTSEFFPEESQAKLRELIEGLETFIDNANIIIGDIDNQRNFKTALANLTEASKQASATLEQIGKFADAGTSSFKNADAKFDNAVSALIDTSKQVNDFAAAGTATLKSVDANAQELVKAVVAASEELSKSASQLRLILEKVNSGQGSAAKFINDGQLYEKLLEDTQQLEEVLKSIQSLVNQVKEKGIKSIY